MPQLETQPIIAFDGVSFSYEGDTPVLRGLSLAVERGEFIAVIGANGSGKSTFAKHVNALLRPDEGLVRVCGLDASEPSNEMAIRSQVAMVFQNPDNQAVASLVEDDVAFGPENLGLEPAEIRQRVDEALEAVGMSDFATAQIHELSGGQKQRVAIAGALAMQPSILVLDEATAMLDVAGRRGLMDIIRRLKPEGMTIILITHFMDEAAQADRVVILDQGAIALDGTPDQVFSQHEALLDLGLDLPFEEELARRLAEKSSTKMDDSRKTAGREGSENKKSGLVDDFSDIELKGASFSYGGSPVLREIDLKVEPGEFLGVIGPMGSGKSTLLQLLNALLIPTRGQVLVNGVSTAQKKRRKEIRSQVGLAFQYPERQLFANTVLEDVAFGPRNLGLSSVEALQSARTALLQMGLDPEEVGGCSPFELSGGQQRRVALAGILAMSPAVLVLDEPAAGMDPRSARQLKSLLADLNAQGTAVVLVSHSMDDVAELCHRVVAIERGRIALAGTPEEVFSADNREVLDAMGLGLPQAAQHALRLAEAGKGLDIWPLTMNHLVEAILSSK